MFRYRQGCQLRLFKTRFRLFLNDLDLEISYLDYGLYLRLFYDVGQIFLDYLLLVQ